jgi:carnitine-CoA ligase
MADATNGRNIDPRMLAPEDCVTRPLIDRRAEETPDRTYAVFPDSSESTYTELKRQVTGSAAGFSSSA